MPNSPHLYFKGAGFRRPFAIIGGILVGGYALRMWVMMKAKSALEVQEETRKMKIKESIDSIRFQENADVNWDRVYKAVEAEEARIAAEEEAVAAIAKTDQVVVTTLR